MTRGKWSGIGGGYSRGCNSQADQEIKDKLMAKAKREQQDRRIKELEEENKRLMDILFDCEQRWGCECPYCDRDFGDDLGSHHKDCLIGQIINQ